MFKLFMFFKPVRKILLGQQVLCFYVKPTLLLLAGGPSHFVQLYTSNVYNSSTFQISRKLLMQQVELHRKKSIKKITSFSLSFAQN